MKYKKVQRLPGLLAVIMWTTHFSSVTQAQESITNYSAAVNREVDLMRSLFVETNRAFDEKLCASLSLKPAESVEVQYLQISLLSSYPHTNDVGPSFSEMVIPHRLVGKPSTMFRTVFATSRLVEMC